MRTTRLARLGAVLLCVALSVAACSTSGKPPAVPAETTVLVDKPVQQLVPIPRHMTDVTPLPPPPAPAIPYGEQACQRPAGCYGNRQLEELLSSSLTWGQGLADQLRAIRRASDEATQPTGEPP